MRTDRDGEVGPRENVVREVRGGRGAACVPCIRQCEWGMWDVGWETEDLRRPDWSIVEMKLTTPVVPFGVLTSLYARDQWCAIMIDVIWAVLGVWDA